MRANRQSSSTASPEAAAAEKQDGEIASRRLRLPAMMSRQLFGKWSRFSPSRDASSPRVVRHPSPPSEMMDSPVPRIDLQASFHYFKTT